jgi:hypothetical protein
MKAAFSLAIFSFLGLGACAVAGVVLVDPTTGATARCAAGIVDECVKKYRSQGYVEYDRLTPAQRAALESRGVRPQPPPTFEKNY